MHCNKINEDRIVVYFFSSVYVYIFPEELGFQHVLFFNHKLIFKYVIKLCSWRIDLSVVIFF